MMIRNCFTKRCFSVFAYQRVQRLADLSPAILRWSPPQSHNFDVDRLIQRFNHLATIPPVYKDYDNFLESILETEPSEEELSLMDHLEIFNPNRKNDIARKLEKKLEELSDQSIVSRAKRERLALKLKQHTMIEPLSSEAYLHLIRALDSKLKYKKPDLYFGRIIKYYDQLPRPATQFLIPRDLEKLIETLLDMRKLKYANNRFMMRFLMDLDHSGLVLSVTELVELSKSFEATSKLQHIAGFQRIYSSYRLETNITDIEFFEMFFSISLFDRTSKFSYKILNDMIDAEVNPTDYILRAALKLARMSNNERLVLEFVELAAERHILHTATVTDIVTSLLKFNQVDLCTAVMRSYLSHCEPSTETTNGVTKKKIKVLELLLRGQEVSGFVYQLNAKPSLIRTLCREIGEDVVKDLGSSYPWILDIDGVRM